MKSSNERSARTMATDLPRGLREGDAPVRPGKSTVNYDEMMAKSAAAGSPGSGHKALEHFAGDWKAEVKYWGDPDSPANVSQATAKGTWIMNGRFLQEDFHGEMMGRRFHGCMLLGFDNVKQSFCSTWISDTQTSIFFSEGKSENGNKVINLKGTASCPVRERGDIPMRIVLRVLSPDKHTFEMFDESSGTKTLEIAYVRDQNPSHRSRQSNH